MRVFVAIELSDSFRTHLADWQQSLRSVASQASFTRPENLHLTLKFIGEVDENRVAPLCKALDTVEKLGEIRLKTTGLDLLPERGPIRIIAAAVDGGEELLSLQSTIEAACFAQEIPRENRRYRPHITLARVRRPLPRSAKSRLMSCATDPAVEMNVTQFVLMQSKLSDQGSQYTPLHHIDL